jgi:ubiquitin-conjugating enzyme E2 O
VLPQERLARVRFFDEGVLLPQIEEISLYDLNSHPILQYGLGDHVMIRDKLLPPPGLVEEVVNIASGFVEGLVRSVTESDDTPEGQTRAASAINTDEVDWMGEVVKINCDGTVKVRLARAADPPPTWTGERYVIAKADDLIVFGDDDEESDHVMDAEGWVDEDGDIWFHGSDDEEDEWEDASEGDMDVDIPEASLDASDDEAQTEDKAEINDAVLNGVPKEEPPIPPEIMQSGNEPREWQINRDKCPAFDILETVPDDHPFKYDTVDGDRGREWLARIRKEHKILQTSLPGNILLDGTDYSLEGILVRTYESRLDLIRVLIIGPKNTPYDSAPFLFDFSLGDNFPNEPPETFFHSWTPGGSSGRVNPNLYVYVPHDMATNR